MDPLSITVSCLTLIGVASKTSLAVTTFIRGCRDARSDLTSVSGELTQLQLVLELLKDDPDVTDDRIIPESLQAQILSIIANCSDVVGKINKVLNKHAGRAGPAKWTAFGKTEVDGLRMSLEAHRGSLSLVLELVSVSLSKAIKEDTAATRTDVRDIRQDTSHIPHIMAELAELRAIVAAGGQSYVLEQYLDSLTSYAETVCQDVVWDSDGSMHLPSAKVSPMPSPKPTPKPSPGNLDQPQETRELELEELRLDPTQGDAETPPNQSSAPSANMETSRGEIEVRVSEPRHGPTEADHPPSRGHSGTPSNAGSTAVAYPTRTLAGTHPNPSHPQSPGNLPLRRLSVRKKVVVIGDGVGKTSFIVTYANCCFPNVFVPEIVDSHIDIFLGDNSHVSLDVWDLNSASELHGRQGPINSRHPDANFFMVAIGIDSPDSVSSVDKWIHEIRCYPRTVPFILVGLRKDLREDPNTIAELALSGQRPVSFEEGKALATRIGALEYHETSAKTGEGVREVFDTVARLSTLSLASPEAISATNRKKQGRFWSLFGIGPKPCPCSHCRELYGRAP